MTACRLRGSLAPKRFGGRRDAKLDPHREFLLRRSPPEEVNSWAGKDLDIDVYRPLNEGDPSTTWAPRTLAFTSESFLLSFSLRNFHFHAVTAYDILRAQGVPRNFKRLELASLAADAVFRNQSLGRRSLVTGRKTGRGIENS